MTSGKTQGNDTKQLVMAWSFLKLYESLELILSALIGAIFAFAINKGQFEKVYDVVVIFAVIAYLLLSLATGFLVTWLNKNNTNQLDSFQLFIYEGYFSNNPDFTKRAFMSLSGLSLILLIIIFTIYV